MQITYELTQEDFYEALLAHRNRKKITKWAVRIWGFSLIVLGLELVENFRLSVAREQIFPSASLYLVLALCFLALSGPGLRWSARKQFRKQPAAHGQKMLVADSSGLHFQGDGTSGDIEWRKLIKWLEAKHLFLVYPSPAYFYMVPKRSMAPDQLTEFRNMLAANIKSK